MTRNTIDVKALSEILDRGEPVTVLDVRPEEERYEWAIPGSVHADVYNALKDKDPRALEGVQLPGGKRVVTVCGAGKTSLTAAGPEEARTRARLLHGSLDRLLSLPPGTVVLPGHTSEPVAFDGAPVATTLGEAREKIEVLRLPEEEFVDRLTAHIRPTPPNYEAIVGFNESGEFPEYDPTDLEAGANRCAAG